MKSIFSMTSRILLLIVVLISVLGAGCNIINPPEKLPTYIHIDSFQVKSSDPGEIITQRISGAWVYFNNQLVGVYDIPGDIPVIADKPGQILINAGINYSGLKTYMSIYPFYTQDSFTLEPAEGKKINFTPTVYYRSTAKIRYKEDFEVGNTFIPTNSDLTDDTSLMRTNDPAKTFGGKGGSGYIYLSSTNTYSNNINNTGFSIAQGESYIEIDYKCTVGFRVGLQAMASGTPVIEYISDVKANDKWTKLYIGLQPATGKYQTGPYRVVISSSLPDGQSEGYVLIDNIKAISY